MSSLHPASLPNDQLLSQCEIKRTRSGGPGGQHRNKVETAIVITHLPTGTVAQAGERRSQHENRRVAIDRLRLNLAVGVRCDVAPQQGPSELWRGRLKGQRIQVSSQHDDFPTLLAEALDGVAASQFDLRPAAERLGVSTSQLIKFLKTHPPALTWVNQQRAELGLGGLK